MPQDFQDDLSRKHLAPRGIICRRCSPESYGFRNNGHQCALLRQTIRSLVGKRGIVSMGKAKAQERVPG